MNLWSVSSFLSPSENIVDFEAAVAVKFATSRLNTIVTDLETTLGAVVKVKTEGQSKDMAFNWYWATNSKDKYVKCF